DEWLEIAVMLEEGDADRHARRFANVRRGVRRAFPTAEGPLLAVQLTPYLGRLPRRVRMSHRAVVDGVARREPRRERCRRWLESRPRVDHVRDPPRLRREKREAVLDALDDDQGTVVDQRRDDHQPSRPFDVLAGTGV